VTSGIAGLSAPDTRAAPRDETASPTDVASPFGEFLIVGGATLFLFPLSWLLRRCFGLDGPELAAGALTFYAAYLVNDPHFSVTYLLFYRRAWSRMLHRDTGHAQRIRYAVAGFLVPACLVGWAAFALATHSAEGLGWMIQLMYVLVGWHYVKQGFGVLTVLSARKGIFFTTLERKIILGHCYAGWAFAWANPSAAAGEFEEKGVVYWAMAHPRWLEVLCGLVLALSTAALVVVLAMKWWRQRRLPPLAPLIGFLTTVWSWTIFSAADRLVQYLIPALHSLQYLYFVWLMKRGEARAEEGPPDFGRPVAVRLGFLALSAVGLGWILFHGAPGILDAALVGRPARGAVSDSLGRTPFVAAFFVVVSIHHYFMDYVLWRRDNPDTRYLRIDFAR
jgi:hypothetical protein